MQLKPTKHAEVRMRQRGIREHQVLSFADYADLDVKVGRSLHALRLSQKALIEAKAEGISSQQVDQWRRMSIVESANGTLVTVAHLHGRKAFAHQRRDRRKFWG